MQRLRLPPKEARFQALHLHAHVLQLVQDQVCQKRGSISESDLILTVLIVGVLEASAVTPPHERHRELPGVGKSSPYPLVNRAYPH